MEFEIPETLDGLDLDALTALENDAVAAFDALRDDPELTGDGLARLRELAGFVRQVRAREGEIMAAAAQVAAELDDLAGQVHGDDDSDDDAGDDDEADPADGARQSQGEPAPPAAGEIPVEPAEPERTPVLASLARRAAARQPKPRTAVSARSARVKAAPDVPNVPNGHLFSSVEDLASAVDERFAAMPRGATVRTRIKQGVARIELPTEHGLVASTGDDFDVVEAAASQSRLSGGNLVAAGGWGAPSETLWDLCPGLETSEGILDLPTVTVTRGGLRYPTGLDFRELFSAIGFVQTEADSIAGNDKSCYRVPTPGWDETRLEVDGICLEHDIVQNAVWPENTREVVRRALVAHDHKINARLIAKMAAATASTAFTLALGSDIDGDQTTTGVLGAVAMAATDYRHRYRMGRRATLEMPAPSWLLDWIRADMARRAGQNFFDITDEQITAWFTRRNVLPRWVYDWQDGYVNPAGAGFGGAATPQQWPGSVDLLLYAPGTWVKGTRGIIELAAVYDSTKLRDNEYIALWSEEATLLVKRCYASYKLTVPLCPSGVTGQPIAFDCVAA
ncbi:major capsid protein [Actinoplanes sp. NPDC049316]|uniref:major capsid protein n=1 Tax=Actinoplanes sp. NPDC049316 TaxID=3154727 RepID=UPI00343D92BD